MGLKDFPKDHPIWDILKIGTVAVASITCFSVALFVTASTFDDTEVRAILAGGAGTISVGATAVGLIKAFWKV